MDFTVKMEEKCGFRIRGPYTTEGGFESRFVGFSQILLSEFKSVRQ